MKPFTLLSAVLKEATFHVVTILHHHPWHTNTTTNTQSHRPTRCSPPLHPAAVLWNISLRRVQYHLLHTTSAALQLASGERWAEHKRQSAPAPRPDKPSSGTSDPGGRAWPTFSALRRWMSAACRVNWRSRLNRRSTRAWKHASNPTIDTDQAGTVEDGIYGGLWLGMVGERLSCGEAGRVQ